jgi:membrane fusion protein, multidrug efflux system
MRRLILPFALAMLAAGAHAQDQGEQPTVLVATATVQEGTLDETVTAYGLVQAAPGAALNLSMPYAGQVLRLRVTVGQRVRKGEPLFEYGTDPGVTLAYQKAASTLSLAKQERAHIASLAAQKLATQSQLDQAETAVRDAQIDVEEQQRLGSDKPSHTFEAPFAGVVASVPAANGDHVQANATMMQLTEDGGLNAVLGVVPENGSRLTPGMPVGLIALSHPAKPAEGKILSVGGQLDPKTQLIDLVVALPTESGTALLPGEHISAQIAVGRLSGWIVPRAAVLTDENGPYLFQVADGKAARVGVSIVGESGDDMAVNGPLDPSRKLVISGNYELTNGMPVREEAGASTRQAALARTTR